MLSGWSNTQFSYWARRSEALSVLAPYDKRLRAIALALEHRLRGGEPPCHTPLSVQSSTTHESGPGFSSVSEPTIEECITGKGLDSIIEEVKKRSGVSQFLRGKHSSLDPFVLPPLDPPLLLSPSSSEHTPDATSAATEGANEGPSPQEVTASQPAPLEFITYTDSSHPHLDTGPVILSPPPDPNDFSISVYNTPSYVNHDLGVSNSIVHSVPSHPISITFQPSQFPGFYAPQTRHQPRPLSPHPPSPPQSQAQHLSSGPYVHLPISTAIPSHILQAGASRALPSRLNQNPLSVANEDTLLARQLHMTVPSNNISPYAVKNKTRDSEGIQDGIGTDGADTSVLLATRPSKRHKIQP